MQRTLLNIKPDAVSRNLVGEICRRIEAAGFRIVAMEKTRMTRPEAEAFYHVHRDKPFFENLVKFMISGPSVPMVVEGENVIEGLRALIGATDPSEAAEGTIRRDMAENVTRNSVHASDSEHTASREIAFFFSTRRLLDQSV